MSIHRTRSERLQKRHTPPTGKEIALRVLRDLILLFFLIMNLFPLVWLLISSFKTNREILNSALSWPQAFSFTNYLSVLAKPAIFRGFLNSLIVTVLSVVINTSVCYMAAYCMSRYNFKYLKILTILLALGLLIPVNSTILPIKIICDKLHLSNSVLGLGLLYASLQIPMSTLILEGHLRGIPKELDEAAALDGASPFRTAVQIVGPVSKAGLVTVLILQAVTSWNEFMFAMLLISDESQKTIQLVIHNFLGMYQTNYGALFAAVIIAVIPMIVLFVIFQSRVIEAFTNGSVKQ